MKRVSFEVAKYFKEVGYPQNMIIPHYDSKGEYHELSGECFCDAPTYLDIWLWLWRKKKIYIDINCIQCSEYSVDVSIWHEYGGYHYECKFTDPDEAIEAAIKYLVENNLIK